MRRLWLVLVCAVLGAWPAAPAAGRASGERGASEGPSVQAAMPGGGSALRGGEGPGPLRLHERLRPVELPGGERGGPPPVLAPGARQAGPPAPEHRDARDVVHARRALGAHLLHFATPPPAGR